MVKNWENGDHSKRMITYGYICNGWALYFPTKSMVSKATFRQLALSLPDVVELPHFDKPSFRVKGKIIATLWVKDNRGMIKLPEVEQSVYCAIPGGVFHPVPGYWGKQGATFVELNFVTKSVLKEALTMAYKTLIFKK